MSTSRLFDVILQHRASGETGRFAGSLESDLKVQKQERKGSRIETR